MPAGQIQASRIRAEWRRSQVSEMYCRLAMRQQEIAAQLGVSQPTIVRDLKILLARWREAALIDVSEYRGKELATLFEMERDCALCFQNTKDPRWMTERRLIMKRRAEMLGLDAPVRISGADGGPIQIQPVPIDPSSLSDAELALLEKIMERHHGYQEPSPQLNP
jgi:hypothetical protein